ncbi:helix-turn-helix transcriptional regulator [Longispora sp. NPDC051575]|uniref:helix-turn-helix domain-containing protein n=1 Tax=Longispora sp. NPDC051575 TaxID=3154943 RepID=UPI00342B6EEF
MMSTTPEGSGSTVPRRQLGRRLRALRTERGLRADEVATAIDLSRQSLWRMETGDSSVKYGRSHIEALCRLYKVDDATREGLVSLAAETKSKGWWNAYTDVMPNGFDVYLDLEAAASSLCWYESVLVPGLLQTPGYAEQILSTVSGRTKQEVDRRVELRMARQKIMSRAEPRAPKVEVRLDEAVLRRPVGGVKVMAAQLRHLNEIAYLPNVTIRVVPFGFGLYQGINSGPFTILGFPQRMSLHDEPSTVYVPGYTGELYLDLPMEIASFAEAFDDISDRALNERDSRNLIARLAEEFET